MTTGPAGPSWPTEACTRRSPSAGNRRRSRSANAGSSSAPTPGSTTTAGCAAAPSDDGAASRPISPWPPPSSPCALCSEPPGTATAGTPGQDHRAFADLLADALSRGGRGGPCDGCGAVTQAAGPAGVTAPVQYGPHAAAIAVYLPGPASAG